MKFMTTKQLTMTALLAAIICILGPIALPLSFSPVPISLGTLGIYFALSVSDFKIGNLSIIVYILLGLVGLPVFASFTSGIGKLMGPTGGYIIGYIFLGLIYGFFLHKFSGKLVWNIVGMVLGTAVCYAFGTAWLGFQLDKTFLQALSIGVIPYIPGDIAKMVIAIALATPIKVRLKKANIL